MDGPPKEKTPHPSELGGRKGIRGEQRALKERLRRQDNAKSHTLRLVSEIGCTKAKRIGLRYQRILECGDWLKYRDYYTGPGLKLHSANFCMNTLVCSLCAIRRASRNMAAYLERFQVLQAAHPTLRPYLVTLTVRNGPDLAERMAHLTDSLKLLHRRRSDNKSQSLMREVAGGVYSIELTNTGKEWHPHVHAIWLAEEQPDMYALRTEWEQITGDSFMCDVRPIVALADVPADIDPHAGGFAEVFKYALKPSELGPQMMVKAYPVLKGKRLLASFGLFRGVQVPASLGDDLTGLEDLPYFELLFRYTATGYKLQVPRDSADTMEGPSS